MTWPFSSAAVDQPKLYSVEHSKAEAKTGEGKPRRHYLLGDQDLVANFDEGMNTLYECFMAGCKVSGNLPFLGKRAVVNGAAGPYVWQTYNEVHDRAKNFGAYMLSKGVASKGHVALYSINRPEWLTAEYGCIMYNIVSVPLYDTLGAEAIQHIVNQTELSLVVASGDKIKNLLQLKSSLPSVKVIISMDAVDADTVAKGKDVGVEIVYFEDAESQGAKEPRELQLPKPDDVLTICYTSGTTGLPKGVILTHRNVLAPSQSYKFASAKGAGITIGQDDIHVSYLPLAHVFERVFTCFVVGVGARIGYYQGDTTKLLDDIAELRPTFFLSVPRLFNRIFDKVWAGVRAKGGIAEKLFNMAFASKKANLPSGIVTHPIWDKLVFGKVRQRLGGRVRFMISGSAPLSSEVMEFLRIAFCCDVLEGYGQTETSAGSLITVRGDTSLGNVGAPFPCNEVKLVDVPEMNYTSADKPYPRGEICFRGHNCFSGYYKMPDKTAETIDADGWVHSGDIGMWDNLGRLKIIDRKKNIFKLAQGEYIAPEKIENVYTNHELVAQAFVYGDSLQASLVGVIVPDEPILLAWAEKNNHGGKSFADLCKSDEVKKHLLAALIKHGKEHDLKGFENIKAIYLEHELFTVENDILTPTFKIKRFEAKQKYKKQIDAMYLEIGTSG